MATPTGSVLAPAVACFNPECVDQAGQPSQAEPEQDTTHIWWVCPACGSEFGHQRTPAAYIEPSCAVGVPEGIRRAASTRPPLMQIGRAPHEPATS